MEFGNAPQPTGSPEINDAARMAASTRLRTLAPAHDKVVADDLSDDEVVTQHMMQPAVANVTSDTEFTEGDKSDNIATEKPHHVALMIIMSACLICAALISYFYIAFL